MPAYNKLYLKSPSFDLAWIQIPSKEGDDSFVLIPGGGGSTKSGVRNIIQVARDSSVLGALDFLNCFDTGDLLCNCISTGIIQDSAVVCAAFDATCHLYTVKLDAGQLSFVKVVEFIADFSTDQAGVNCSAVISSPGSSAYVVTAGEDGSCRVWTISVSTDDGAWAVERKSELSGHTGPVMSLSVGFPAWETEGPNGKTGSSAASGSVWLASGSRDGTIKLWDVTSGTLMGQVTLEAIADSKEAEEQASKNSKKKVAPLTAAQKQLQCRGCVFSADASCLYYIQSGSRGSTFLVKAMLNASATEDAGAGGAEVVTVTASTLLFTKVGSTPSTRLRISECVGGGTDKQLLAVGSSDGTIAVFRQQDLSEVTRLVAVHDFPVTGLSFRPVSLAAQAVKEMGPSMDNKMFAECLAIIQQAEVDGVTLVSCSADNKLLSLQVRAQPGSAPGLVVILLVIVVITGCVLLLMAEGDYTRVVEGLMRMKLLKPSLGRFADLSESSAEL